MSTQLIQRFAESRRLPRSYVEDAERWILPFATGIADLPRKRPHILGINGSQGSGKSTLSALLAELFEERGLHTAIMSLDDFYFDRASRAKLAAEHHPLLVTRGVPGTHDVELALATLKAITDGETVALPRFDKANDEPLPQSQWPVVSGASLDILIFEGWCLGAEPQNSEMLEHACNRLEKEEDRDGRWRRFVNDALAGSYQSLFQKVEQLLLLQAPSFDCVTAWRDKQEEELRESQKTQSQGVMSPSEIVRFVQHFERLTHHCLTTLPARADKVFKLDSSQRIIAAS